MTRLIDADAFAKKAYDVAYPIIHGWNDHERGLTLLGIAQLLDEQPAVDAVPVRHGKWVEKHHAYSDEESVIEEWQSCRCSECGRYDTRPYMYYFDEPNYCSYCGADMRGEQNEAD